MSHWEPENIFLSHSTNDFELKKNIKFLIEEKNVLKRHCKLFVSEYSVDGGDLTEKFRTAIDNSNALMVLWTKNVEKNKNTQKIISFEIGMAYSSRIPIYIFVFDDLKVPWFYDHITGWHSVKDYKKKSLKKALSAIEIDSFIHPLEIIIPKEPHPNPAKKSLNNDVLITDEKIVLTKGMNGILHYYLKNNRKKPEKNVRFKLIFPNFLEISYNPGKLEVIEGTRRMEFFYPIKYSNGLLLFWPSFPPESEILFEVRIKVSDKTDHNEGELYLAISSDNIIGERIQNIAICY